MSLSTRETVKAGFQRAVEETLKKSLRTPEDWDRYNAIIAQAQTRLAQEQKTFAHDFEQRMAEARQIVLRQEHGLTLDQRLPPGAEARLSPQALEAKAETRVYRDHERRLATIREDALDQYVDLSAEIRARDAPTQAFNRAHDRSQDRSPQRSGPKHSQ